MRLAVTVFTLVVLALAAVACGSSGGGILSGGASSPQTKQGLSSSGAVPELTSSPSGSSKAAVLDPCQLLTKADAEAALGMPVDDPKASIASTNPLGQKLCSYSAANATPNTSVQLSLITTSGLSDQMKKNGWSAKQQFDSEKKLSASTAVSGLGDDAFIRGPNLYVLKGDTDMSIQLFNGPTGTPEHTAALKALAAKLLPRLP